MKVTRDLLHKDVNKSCVQYALNIKDLINSGMEYEDHKLRKAGRSSCNG